MTTQSTPNQTTTAAPASASDPGVTTPAAGDTPVDTTGQSIPKHRFDEVNQKRKEAEAALSDVAVSVIESMVPENMRAIVPELPAAQKIKWVYEAVKADRYGIGIELKSEYFDLAKDYLAELVRESELFISSQ